METGTKIVLALLGGGALYLLFRDGYDGPVCLPPQPTRSPGMPADSYQLVGMLWDPATCSVLPGPAGQTDDRMAMTKKEAEDFRARVGQPLPADHEPLPPNQLGLLWIFDEHGNVFLRAKAWGNSPLEIW